MKLAQIDAKDTSSILKRERDKMREREEKIFLIMLASQIAVTHLLIKD